MMDFSLLKNPVFIFIVFGNVIGFFGYFVPIVFLVDAAIAKVSRYYK
jgi:hypothetical protein